MCFSEHYNDIRSLILENRSPDRIGMKLYGTSESIDVYDNGYAPIQFWSLDEGVDYTVTDLFNTLYIEGNGYEYDDLYFNTKCVGYAVENGYDNIIVETPTGDYCITIDLREETTGYLLEDKPLKGKRISKERRKALKDKRSKKNKVGAPNKPVKKPKKAPKRGIRADVLLANTGKLSPARVERAIKEVSKKPPKITGVQEIDGMKYFRAEYIFKSKGASKTQMGYADVSSDKEYISEVFCTCADFFYRLYAPYVAAGLATWNIPSKYKAKQRSTVLKAPHNHTWTELTNPQGSLFLCKHLWAFIAYYISGEEGNVELSDEEIDKIIGQYFGDVETGDDDDEEIDTSSNFQKAYGKLYVADKGKDIEHHKAPVKNDKNKRQVFYQPKKTKKPSEEE